MRRVGFLNAGCRAARCLQLENLEQRQPLAGNVTVSVSGGTVTVTGDAASNNISIYQQTNGRFNIIANDGEVITGPATDLNIRNLTVNLGDGDDVAKIGAQTAAPFPASPAQILGATRVNGGAGANEIYVSVNGAVNGERILPALSITVDTQPTGDEENGEVDDFIVVGNSSAANVTVRTGAGNDSLQVGGTTALNLTVDAGPATTAEGVPDDDQLTSSVNKIANATISMGGGDNNVTTFSNLWGALSITTGDGDDIVSATTSVIARSLTVNTNGGADTVFLDEVTTGLGPDALAAADELGIDLTELPPALTGLINLLPNLPGRINVSTGNGDDTVYALRLNSALITVGLNGGDDTLYAQNIDALISLFNGGPGTDGKFSEAIEGANTFLSFEEELENPFPE